MHLRLREQPQSRRLPFRIDGLRLLDRNERPMWVRTRETAAVIVNSLSETEDQAGNPGIELYPNPTGGELFLKASGAVIQQVELFGTDGRKVETWMAPSGINLESYPAGIYFLKVFTDRGVVMEAVSVVR